MGFSLVRGLEVFCALIEHGSATAAARSLNMSQPAVSQQISRLERELRLALFVRENGKMRPTETSLILYEEAFNAFNGLERVLNLAQDIRGLQRGQLRVAAPYSTSSYILPKALRILTGANPQMRVQVYLGNYDKIATLVAAREVDFGIAKSPIMVPGIEFQEVFTSELVAVMNTKNQITRRHVLQVSDLTHEPLIMIGRGRPWRDEIDVAFRKARIAPRIVVETQSVDSACGFAAQGFGTAIVPEWLTYGVNRENIAVRALNFGIRHRFLVIYPARSGWSQPAFDFADACRKVWKSGQKEN